MDYDACGNMVYQEDNGEGLKKQMHYDAFNRISEVRDPDSGRLIGEYHYDDGGFRVRKLARRMMEGEEKLVELLYPSMYFGIETQRTYEGQEIPDTSYAVNNIYINGVRVAALIPSGAARYYHTDQVDSVKVVTDDTGMPVSRFEYLPYGETWVEETADDVDEEHNPKYNSQELDRETNFYYYNARHYDPVICRFVTADTVVDGEGSAFGWNRYMYVHGNPVMYRDPSGRNLLKSLFETANARESDEDGLIANSMRKGGQKGAEIAIREITDIDKFIDAYENGDTTDKALATINLVEDLISVVGPRKRTGKILFNVGMSTVSIVGAGKAGYEQYQKTFNTLVTGKETKDELKKKKNIALAMGGVRSVLKFSIDLGLNKLIGRKLEKRLNKYDSEIERIRNHYNALPLNNKNSRLLIKDIVDIERKIEKTSNVVANHVSRLFDRRVEDLIIPISTECLNDDN